MLMVHGRMISAPTLGVSLRSINWNLKGDEEMTVIEIERGDGWLRVSMEGHAGYGAYGADPVCGGLSALAYTGARMLEELDAEGKLTDRPQICMKPGRALLDARAKTNGKEELAFLGRTLLGGFRLMAETFPTAVELRKE